MIQILLKYIVFTFFVDVLVFMAMQEFTFQNIVTLCMAHVL